MGGTFREKYLFFPVFLLFLCGAPSDARDLLVKEIRPIYIRRCKTDSGAKYRARTPGEAAPSRDEFMLLKLAMVDLLVKLPSESSDTLTPAHRTCGYNDLHFRFLFRPFRIFIIIIRTIIIAQSKERVESMSSPVFASIVVCTNIRFDQLSSCFRILLLSHTSFLKPIYQVMGPYLCEALH